MLYEAVMRRQLSKDLNKVKERAMQLSGRKNIAGREKARVYVGRRRNTKEAREAGAQRAGEARMGSERRLGKPQHVWCEPRHRLWMSFLVEWESIKGGIEDDLKESIRLCV